MFIINLHNLIFFSFHGLYEEERILGNNYEVNVVLSYHTDQHINKVEQTINYAPVYEIIKKRMSIPTPLLETITQDLTQLIHNFDNRIKTVSVSIEKKNPPIPNMEGSVNVTYKKDY